MPVQKRKKLFISHSSADTDIGEKLLDALVDLGVDKSEVFYSSLYHTGARLGNDFHKTVKQALNEAEIVIFLLTRSFYKSEFCLNEMGAVWINNIRFIPILLGGITYGDMKGFIDDHYIAFTPDRSETYKLVTELQPFLSPASSSTDLERAFDEFIELANKMAAENAKIIPADNSDFSKTEQTILSGRFTDDEILFMGYFANTRNNALHDVVLHDELFGTSKDSPDLVSIKAYSQRFSFDYCSAKSLLEQSGLLKCEYDWRFGSDEYQGCRLDIDVFRDIISLSDAGKRYVQEVLARHTLASSATVETANSSQSLAKETTTLENIILSPKFKELEALLLSYMLDTSTNSLGDRWMESVTIKEIKQWEYMNDLNSKLSYGYADALKMLKFRNLVDVASTTSYGNPREYKLKDAYLDQLNHLTKEALDTLEEVKNNNVATGEENPFTLTIDDLDIPF